LEQRLVLSQALGTPSVVADHSPATGEFFHNFQQFNYTTPQGTHVEIHIVGRGSLKGTTVDSTGALHILFSMTNAYTKIMSNVHGGTGQADLASIYSADVYVHGAAESLSGIGSSVLHTINLPNFNLIAGGVIDVTSGIDNLNLNSVGPNTQIQLRELPSTLQAGQSTSVTSAGVNNSFVTNAFLVQSLAGINGEFVSAGNIVNVTTSPGNGGPPAAPPGIVLKINHINGNVTTPPSLLSDNKIFGYDPATGQVIRFSLQPTNTSAGEPNMARQVGTVDTSFTPIQVEPPGSPIPVDISVGRDGTRLVLLVSTGSKISVYDATYGTPLGSFATPAGFVANALASTDTLSVMGDIATNQLKSIDVAASLSQGTAQVLATTPASIPAAGVFLLGGLTGHAGSNQSYASVHASFNPLQPGVPQLGLLTVDATTSTTTAEGLILSNGFVSVSQSAFTVHGAYVPVPNAQLFGASLGSVDSNLAFNTVNTSNPSKPITNIVDLYGPVSLGVKGTISLLYPNQLSDLSESFRPDLNGSSVNGIGPALIDIQGNVQSLRGTSANGLVLNDTGFLNLIRTGRISNSTILAQPIGHVDTPMLKRTNTTLLSSNNRATGRRGGVALVAGLTQIGPLSLTNDSPPTT
jgi:hypothetical protein